MTKTVCRSISVLAFEYRLAPEHPFLAALEDSCATLRWLASNVDMLSVDPDRIDAADASAGGRLVAAMALLPRDRGETW
jgi:acetyl esterase